MAGWLKTTPASKVSRQTRERLACLATERGSGFIVDAAAGRAVLAVPALCLCAAESQRPGIADHVGMLPVDIEPLELSAVIRAGKLIGEGVDWRIAHAIAAAMPSAQIKKKIFYKKKASRWSSPPDPDAGRAGAGECCRPGTDQAATA